MRQRCEVSRDPPVHSVCPPLASTATMHCHRCALRVARGAGCLNLESCPVVHPVVDTIPDTMALISSDCDAMRSPSIKWP